MADLFASFSCLPESADQASTACGMSAETIRQVLCAWCLAEQGLPFGSGSHGICPMHADQLISAYRASRADPVAMYSTENASSL